MEKGEKQSIFPILLLQGLKCNKNKFFFFFWKDIQTCRLSTSLAAYSGLRSSRLLKLYQCESDICMYMGNEGVFIRGPQGLHFVNLFLDHSFLNYCDIHMDFRESIMALTHP